MPIKKKSMAYYNNQQAANVINTKTLKRSKLVACFNYQ